MIVVGEVCYDVCVIYFSLFNRFVIAAVFDCGYCLGHL